LGLRKGVYLQKPDKRKEGERLLKSQWKAGARSPELLMGRGAYRARGENSPVEKADRRKTYPRKYRKR